MSNAKNGETDASLEAGLKFVHAQVGQLRRDSLDMTSRVLALSEELVARGLLDMRSLDERREHLRQIETQRLDKQPAVVRWSNDEVDKYSLTEVPPIPCTELLPICKARCCRLTFYITRQDIEEGVVKWELGAPYRIRSRNDGYCEHVAPELGCGIYAKRPSVCRRYDCRLDKRVWTDYEQRVPAPDDAIPQQNLVQLRVAAPEKRD